MVTLPVIIGLLAVGAGALTLIGAAAYAWRAEIHGWLWPDAPPTIDAVTVRTGSGAPEAAPQPTTAGNDSTWIVEASDPEGGHWSAIWTIDGVVVADEPSMVWRPDAAGTYALAVAVSDGVHTVDWSASVQVLPANQPPEVDLRVFSLGRGKFRLDATGSVDPEGGALIYTWSVGDGAPSPGEALLERTFSPGTHRVSLSVVDDHGLEVRTAVPLVVSNGAPAVVLKAPKSVVAGTPTAWGATASDPDGDAIVSWQWSFSDGTHASGPKVTHTWPLAGQAWVRVVATDNRGLSGEATKALVVGRPNGPPKVALKAPDGPVAGEAGLWEAVAHDPDGDSIVSWTWSFGGRTATGRSVRHVWPKAGTFDVRVVAVDSHGLAGEATTKVKVLAKNRPPTINSADCDWSGSSITFDVDAVDPDAGDTLEYRWDLGDGRKATTEKGDVAAPSVRHGQMCTVEIRDGRGGTATRTVPLNTVF